MPMPAVLPKEDCVGTCTKEQADAIYNSYAAMYANCLDDTCRAQVQVAYRAELHAVCGCQFPNNG